MGDYLFDQLQRLYDHPVVGDVRGGLGLLAAVELVQDRESKTAFPADAELAKRLPKLLWERKLVSFRAGDIISLCPPLSITSDEVDFIVNALDDTLTQLESDLGVS
jgi:4-aminobutyrate--pyruvate transaminase